MIINGGSRSARGYWVKHLQRADTNEHVRVIELRGLAGATIDEALLEMEIMALGTRCKNFMYHANINPRADEVLTPEQWQQAIDQLENNLGYDGLPRVVVEHEKHGRTHQHVIWSRIDPDLMIARSDSLTARIHEQTSRELEIAFGLERGRSVLVPNREEPRPERRPRSWESFRGQESGISPEQVAAQVRALYAQAENGRAFAEGLDEAGYILCRGDQRGYCILDQAGDVHSLGRRVGVKAAELRAFMQDVPLASLPSVAEARTLWQERQPARTPEPTREAERQPSSEPVLALEREPMPLRYGEALDRGAEAAGKSMDVAGRAAGVAGNMLGGAGRILGNLGGALADFFTGAPSHPPVPYREVLPPEREPAPRALTPLERLKRSAPDMAARRAEIEERERAEGRHGMPLALQEAFRRRAEEAEERRREQLRERDRGRER